MVTRQNDSTGTAIYELGGTGNAHFAGDITLGQISLVHIPQPGTITLYTTDGTSINMVDSTGAKTLVSSGGGSDTFATLTINPGPINTVGPLTSTTEFTASVTGDANARYIINADGTMGWGPGTGPTDTNLYRATTGQLNTDGVLGVGGNLNVSGQVIDTKSSDAQAFTANYSVTNTTNAAYNFNANAATGRYLAGSVTGDSVGRYSVTADGTTTWGAGAGARDTTLSRTGVGVLTVTGLTSTNLLTANGGTKTSGSAPAITPTFANGTASQLTDLTRDYMVYLQIGTAGTAFTLAIGPTSGVATTIMASATPLADSLLSVRLPAGWFLKWAGTSTTLTTQSAVGC